MNPLFQLDFQGMSKISVLGLACVLILGIYSIASQALRKTQSKGDGRPNGHQQESINTTHKLVISIAILLILIFVFAVLHSKQSATAILTISPNEIGTYPNIRIKGEPVSITGESQPISISDGDAIFIDLKQLTNENIRTRENLRIARETIIRVVSTSRSDDYGF